MTIINLSSAQYTLIVTPKWRFIPSATYTTAFVIAECLLWRYFFYPIVWNLINFMCDVPNFPGIRSHPIASKHAHDVSAARAWRISSPRYWEAGGFSSCSDRCCQCRCVTCAPSYRRHRSLVRSSPGMTSPTDQAKKQLVLALLHCRECRLRVSQPGSTGVGRSL